MLSLDSSIDLPVAKLTILIFVDLYLYIFPLNRNCINGESIKEREANVPIYNLCLVTWNPLQFVMLSNNCMGKDQYETLGALQKPKNILFSHVHCSLHVQYPLREKGLLMPSSWEPPSLEFCLPLWPFCSWMSNIHELSRDSNGTRSLDSD